MSLSWVLLGVSAALAAPANLVENGGLEGALGREGLPKGWGRFSPPLEAYKSRVVAGGRSGAKALLVEGDGEYGGVVAGRFPLPARQRGVARGWIRVTDPQGGAETGTASVKLDYFDDRGEWVDSDVPGALLSGTPGWQVVSVSGRQPPPARAKLVAATVVVTGQAKAWFDDLELVTRPAVENLLPNGEMETVLGTRPTGYALATTDGGSAVIGYSAEAPREGWFSLRLHGQADWATAAADRVPVRAGRRYVLRGFCRARAGSAQIKLDYFKDQEHLGQTASTPVAGSQWQERTVRAELDRFPTATHIAAAAVGLGQFDACYDHLRLTAE